MRAKPAVSVVLVFLSPIAIAPLSFGQDDGLQAYYWPHRSVGIPVDVERIGKLPNKPSDLQLFYSVNRGQFQKGPKLALTAMQNLDGGKKGFLFNAERDGDFEFTVQFIYPDNSTSPRTDELTPQQRIVVDTTPPQVKLYPNNNGVEWTTSDDNLDPRGITLQCKWPASTEWTTVNDRQFRTADRFAWSLQPGKVLEVRVLARDRAGNEGVSPVVRVPPEPGSVTSFPRTGGDPVASNLPQARIDYVNTLEFDIDYTIQRMGRSGVQAAHLFVLRNQGNWELVKRFPVPARPMPSEKEQTLSLPYKAKEEGTYGFYVLPESGAGKKADDPRKEDPPMVYVVVDTTAPYIQITGVQVKKGGTRGPMVEITWKAADPNLMPLPISLEWSLDAKATKWNEIKYRLDNNLTRETGRYSWEVPDEQLWKFYVRARAVDKASNTGEHIWGQDAERKNPPVEVIVDLETPGATINKVRSSGAPKPPAGGGSDTPPIQPPTGGGGTGGPKPPEVPDLPKLPM